MAGYQTSIYAPTWCDDLLVVLLRAAQRRARELGLVMRYTRRERSTGERAWSVSVDGNGYRIAAWSRQLERELPIVAEGFVGKPSGRRAVHIAESFVARWTEWAVGRDESLDTRIRTSVRDKVAWIWPILDYLEGSEMSPRMVLADDILAQWIAAAAPVEIVVEEVHTIAEGLLRAATTSGRSVTFPQLLNRAREKGLLTEEQAEELRLLNREYRVRLKHRTECIADSERETVEDLIWSTIGTLDRLMESYGMG